jgi:hypothetical protein
MRALPRLSLLLFLVGLCGSLIAHDIPVQLPPPQSAGEAWNVVEQSKGNISQLVDANLMRDVYTPQFPNGTYAYFATAVRIYKSRNPFLRGYYQLWGSLPYVRNAIQGSGFYAIDETLRKRFDEFPAITNDDKFIRDLSRTEERQVVEGCHTYIQIPTTFADLIKVKTRWSYGAMELAATRPDLLKNDHKRQGLLGHILPRPWLWPHVPTFLFVSYLAGRAAKKKLAQKSPAKWERDNSTRTLAA